MYSLAQFWVGSVPVCVHVNWKTSMANVNTINKTRNQSMPNSDGFDPDAGKDAAADDAVRVPHLPRRSALHLVWRHYRALHLFRGKTVTSIGFIYFPRSVGERFNVGVWFNGIHVCDGHCRCDGYYNVCLVLRILNLNFYHAQCVAGTVQSSDYRHCYRSTCRHRNYEAKLVRNRDVLYQIHRRHWARTKVSCAYSSTELSVFYVAKLAKKRLVTAHV